MLIRGNIGKELRTVRYLDRMRRGTQRLRFHAAAPPHAAPPPAAPPVAAAKPADVSPGRSAER